MTEGQVHDDTLWADVQWSADLSTSESRNGVVARSYPYAESRSLRMQSTLTMTRFGRTPGPAVIGSPHPWSRPCPGNGPAVDSGTGAAGGTSPPWPAGGPDRASA